MSLLKTNAVQIGQSVTADNNFVWYQPAIPDGTIRLGNGVSGSVTDVLTIGAGGNVIFTGTILVSGTSASAAVIRLYEDTDNGTNYVALKAPASIASDLTWVLPSADGASGQALKTDGAGNLSFGPVDALPSQTGNSGKYLTTNGSSASWATLAAGITATDDTSTNASYYPSLFTATSGSQSSAKVSSTKLYFNPSTGTLSSTIFNSLSDATQKTNVVKIENATETLKNIDGFEFDWIENNNHSAGVIAQQLEKILPFLVSMNEDGVKSVNYSGLIAYLIQSNKELAARIEVLENGK